MGDANALHPDFETVIFQKKISKTSEKGGGSSSGSNEEGAEKKDISSRDLFPLHYAVRTGDEKLCVLLLKFGADPYQKGMTGESPYFLCRNDIIRRLMAPKQVCCNTHTFSIIIIIII